jgi:Winged helix-turn helix
VRGPTAHGYATQLWTLARVAEVIERITGVRYHPGHVWRLLRELGWSVQRPARRAAERDEVGAHHNRTARFRVSKSAVPPDDSRRGPPFLVVTAQRPLVTSQSLFLSERPAVVRVAPAPRG